MNVSIIITTRNRAPFLKETLEALRPVAVPDGLEAELVVVDNDSTDETAAVVQSARLDQIAVRYLHEGRPGKSHALNRALAETRSEFLLFTDDDVSPPADWIVGMCRPLRENGPCAVAGGVRIAPTLSRAWMTPLHRSWLAATEWLDPDRPRGMVGANMGFSRDLLRRVPAFDPELGPGALGFGDEQLFASQLLQAGYRIIGRQDVCVEHHFDPQRLQRSAWLSTARKRGRSQAYRGHHWEHWGSRWVRPRLVAALARLALWRLRHPAPAAEGCPEQELKLEFECALLHGHLRERHRPRNYAYRSLVKQRPEMDRPEPVHATPAPANE
jgi:glycosyltransferase involved in cell wall biosynthesis